MNIKFLDFFLSRYQLPEQYDFEWFSRKMNYLRPYIRQYWEAADYTKIPFNQDSEVHGKAHCKRVLTLSILLGFLQAVPQKDFDSLATAAIYHDVGRLSDMEEWIHGQISAEKYELAVQNPDPMAAFLMTYHSCDDTEGEAAAAEMDDPNRALQLLKIFKDADALDRIRFGLGDLDPSFLRLDESKKLICASIYLFVGSQTELNY